MYIFLLLSFFSGMLELGSVYIGLKLGLNMGMILLVPLAYQVGNLMINFNKNNRYKTLCLVCIVGIMTPVWFVFHNIWIIAIQTALISYCIQDLRNIYKTKCPTWLKRSFRIGGFMASPIMFITDGEIGIVLCVCACLLSLLMLNGSSETKRMDVNIKRKLPSQKISFVMIFHQLHYFVYTYLMPVYIYQHTNNIFFTSLMFAFSWIVYLLPQVIVEKLGLCDYKKIFFLCHTFLAICMAGISFSIWSQNIPLVFIFWLLTGLGGGSVFCIRYLSPVYQDMDMDLSENIGHLLGPIIAILICCANRKTFAILLPAVSCLFVIVAILIALKIAKENKNE